MTAASLDDLFAVRMPTQHTQTFSVSDLSLAEEIVDTDNGTADVGGDTECAVAQESAYLRALLSGLDRSPLGLTCVWEDNAA